MVCWQVLEAIEQHYLSLKRKRRLEQHEASTTRLANTSNNTSKSKDDHQHHQSPRTTVSSNGGMGDNAGSKDGRKASSPLSQPQQQQVNPNPKAKQYQQSSESPIVDGHGSSNGEQQQQTNAPHQQEDDQLTDAFVDVSKTRPKKKQARRLLPLQRSSIPKEHQRDLEQQEEEKPDMTSSSSSASSSPSRKKRRGLPLNSKKKSLSTPAFTAPSAIPTVTPSLDEKSTSTSSKPLGSSTGTYDDDDQRLIKEYVEERFLDLDDPLTVIVTGDGVQIPTEEHVERIRNAHPPIISGLHGNKTKRAKISLISWNIRLKQLQRFKNEYGHSK